MSDFVHLHNHTHYSLQDAACTVDTLIAAAVEHKQTALALTDHGVMYGVSEFYKKAKKAGIKPIIGSEIYIVSEGSRFSRGEKNESLKKTKHYRHLILLAKNNIGYKNLTKLVSIGFTEGFYYKPRIDMEVLKKYKEGLIVTTACLGGIVAAPFREGNHDKAREIALEFKELFGDDFYLEIQEHWMDGDEVFRNEIPKLAKELNIKLVATNDIHYVKKEHAIAHNILLLMSDKTGDKDYKELRYRTDEIYFKSSEEMKALFPKYPEAISNTIEIANKIEDNIQFGGLHFPDFPIPKDSTAKNLSDYLEVLAKAGLEKRYAGKEITKEVWDRFNFEIKVINDMGYPGYFLITSDFINAAKDMGIPVGPGRGSAAGSLVAYALRITNVNPLDYDLLFERFLNPARQSMPDIDIDFSDDQRGEVIEYVKKKYGEDSVCQIVTFNRLSSKAVLKDVARVLKISIPTVTSITKFIPSKFGKVYSIEESLAKVAELKWVKNSSDPQIKDLIKYAKVLEGMNRNNSKHAAGVVIAPGPVSDYVALATAGTSRDLVTQFNMKELEASAGLLKMDFLGLRTLSIIRDAIKLIEKNRGIKIVADDIPIDDEKTYELFAKGQTTGVFQFESGAMREHLKNLKPTSIKDLAAMNALYRPGPMEFIETFIKRKQGKEEVKYDHPILEPILGETYGIIVYQEQVIKLANQVAGMSLADADILRRAMGKKDLAAMKEQREWFVKGAKETNNISAKIATEIFDNIDKFANYGFNKSHAVAYGYVAYQTAFLKANYLPEFLASNLTHEFGNSAKVSMFLEECRKMKIQVLPPDVNIPSVDFSVDGDKIIFGMKAIKNVGAPAVEALRLGREKLGRDFKTIYDVCSNVDTRIINKRALEGFVLAGGFDILVGTRAQNFAAIEAALAYGSKYQAAKESLSGGLFGEEDAVLDIEEPELPNIKPWPQNVRLAKEREVLNFYLSDHPLRKYELEYKSFASVHLGEAETFEGKEYVVAIGVVTEFRTKIDRSGKEMAFFKIDDFSGSCECLMFSKNYGEFGNCLIQESTVIVRGNIESTGDSIKIHVEDAFPLEEARAKFTKKILLNLNSESHNEETITKMKKILGTYSGSIPVYLRLHTNGTMRDFYLNQKISITESSISDLLNLLGENGIKYLSS
ncbi:MAG: DNA polymerase III subunit alpha [Bacteroidetes bacterium]|nr:DNA polymerase III subunit alpha [Bacteroidota bacterium]MBU1115963.1 DNA polymerase III subunit alpha [Bacteroidota bacterium]MBU1798440.1 DNA polymerase III subunit alpha [Bacteroidota bacterium]